MKFSYFLLNIACGLLLFISCEEDNATVSPNNPPFITNQTFVVKENSPNGTLIGTFSAFDLEGATLKFEITDHGIPFKIEESTGNLLVNEQSLLNSKIHSKFTFNVKVSETKDSTSHNSAIINVILDNQNNPPVIINQTFEVEENSPNGTLVGTITASDLDGDQLKYEILDTEDVPFTIEEGTGKIVVKDQGLLDFESHSKYTFLLKVTDSNSIPLNNIVVITVAIKNVSEFPNSGIIARYPFNGSAMDIGPNKYDGDLVGVTGTTDRKGLEGGAFAFDGMNDYIKLSTKVGTGVRSISMWFCLGINIDNRNNTPVTLLTRDGDTSNRKLFSLVFIPNGWAGDAGKLRFIYTRTTEDIYYVQSNSNFWRKGIWHHVVVTIDPVKGMMMYIDNEKQQNVTPFYDATDATDSSDIYPLNVYVGNYSPWSSRYFNGKLDDLVVFDKALNEDEIDELFKE